MEENIVENDIENFIQISSILLKLKGYDEKLSDLGKIDTNEGNISSNLGKITTNEGNISSNLGKIDGNIKAIKLINKNSQDNSKGISSNLVKITANEGNISSNLNQINDIKYILPILEKFKKAYSIKNQSFKFYSNVVFLNY